MDNPESTTKGGFITKEYAIECAACANIETLFVESIHAAERLVRLYKWCKTDHLGWICPECVERKKTGEVLKMWEAECKLPGG